MADSPKVNNEESNKAGQLHRGAQCHAARQQAWRERCAEKVTHQGCASTGPAFTMPVTVDRAAF